MEIGEEPTHLVLDEEELYRMDEWLDERVYKHENVRKFGYAKVTLHDNLAGECSTGEDFLKMFGMPKQGLASKLNRSVLYTRPHRRSCDGLYMCKHVQSFSPEVEKAFFEKVQADEHFLHGANKKSTLTCCMKALQTGGEEGYITHLEQTVWSKSVPLGVGSFSKSSEKSTSVHERRIKKLKSAPPHERAHSTLLAMQTEDIKAGPFCVGGQGCDCVKCQVDVALDGHNASNSDGFLYCANIEESPHQNLQLSKNVRMSFLSFCNMLSFLPEYFSGISYPALYLGEEHSLFNLHIEDMSLWSFNFLLAGAPKYWLIIPPSYIRELNAVLEREGFGNLQKFCCRRLMHKCYFILPKLLKENGIPYSCFFQRQGEGIILLPNAAHTGANLGVNLAEACNLGTPAWLPYGCQSDACSCTHEMVHADLSPLIQKFGCPGLLRAYQQETVHLFMATDEYFQQSSLAPLNATSEPPRKRTKPDQSMIPVECPVCRYEWKSTQNKRNIATHIGTYHRGSLQEELVQNFIRKHNLKV